MWSIENNLMTDYRGLSTDTKPVDGLYNGSTFLEMDTGAVYCWNADSNAWVLQPSVHIDPADISDSVETWLDNHPEATTTVEDGSITYAKLHTTMQEKVDDITDLKNHLSDLAEEYTISGNSSQTVFTGINIEAGKTYLISNETNATISCSLNSKATGSSVVQDLGNVAPNRQKSFTALVDAPYFRVYFVNAGTVKIYREDTILRTIEANLQEEIDGVRSDVEDIYKQYDITAPSPSKTTITPIPMQIGDKLIIKNNSTTGSIQCTANSGTPGSVLQSFGTIAAGKTLEVTLTVDAPYFRIWWTAAITTGDTATVVLGNTYIGGIQSDIGGIQSDIGGIQSDIGGIQSDIGITPYHLYLPTSETGTGTYWLKYYDVNLSAGTTLEWIFENYTGTKFRYFAIQGRRTGASTYSYLFSAVKSFPSRGKVVLAYDYDSIMLQIARTESEWDVSADIYLITDATYNVGSEIIRLDNKIDSIPASKRYTCLKDGTGDFSSLVTAINTVCEEMDAILYVGPGTWDLIDELGADYLNSVSSSKRGLYLKNRVHVICSSEALITCIYTGDRADTITWLSAFNAGENGFTLENARINTAKVRYTIHDERDRSTDFYENKYINCTFIHDNTDGGYNQCIGGGLGFDGHIIIDGCIFQNPHVRQTGIVSYHQTWYGYEDPTAEYYQKGRSQVEVKGCYFKGTNTFRCSYFGESHDIATFMVHGNSLGLAPVIVTENPTYDEQHPDWINNCEMFAWGNEIRSS